MYKYLYYRVKTMGFKTFIEKYEASSQEVSIRNTTWVGLNEASPNFFHFKTILPKPPKNIGNPTELKIWKETVAVLAVLFVQGGLANRTNTVEEFVEVEFTTKEQIRSLKERVSNLSVYETWAELFQAHPKILLKPYSIESKLNLDLEDSDGKVEQCSVIRYCLNQYVNAVVLEKDDKKLSLYFDRFIKK